MPISGLQSTDSALTHDFEEVLIIPIFSNSTEILQATAVFFPKEAQYT